jgi:DNA-3-methyladenine glycosylase II
MKPWLLLSSIGATTPKISTHSDNEVVKELSSIKGIGKWTIDMILLYTLNRPNVFPYEDFHLKQIMVSLYGLNEKVKLKAQMLAVAENWGEQKSLAVLYLLAYKQYNKSL